MLIGQKRKSFHHGWFGENTHSGRWQNEFYLNKFSINVCWITWLQLSLSHLYTAYVPHVIHVFNASMSFVMVLGNLHKQISISRRRKEMAKNLLFHFNNSLQVSLPFWAGENLWAAHFRWIFADLLFFLLLSFFQHQLSQLNCIINIVG